MRRTFAAVLTTALALAGPVRIGAQGPPEPVEIPVILSLTGQAAFVDKAMQQSLVLVEKYVNGSGGIQGRPIKLTYYDDTSNAQTAVSLVSQLIAKNVSLILGPGFVPTCQATMPLLAKSGPVSMCFSPLIRPTRGSYTFAASVSAFDQVRGYLRYFRDRGWTRLALLMSTDATGQAAERAYDVLLSLPENRAFQVVARDHFNPADLSVDAQVQHVRATGPDVLISTVTGAPFATVLRALNDAGMTIPVASSLGNMTYVQMEQYKAILPKTLLFPGLRAISRQGTPAGPVREAQQRYFAAFDAIGLRPDAGTIVTWDHTLVAIDALRRLGTRATAEQIRNYIENLHGWVGINGVYDFGDAEHRGIGADAMVVDQWDAARNEFIAVSRPGGRLRGR